MAQKKWLNISISVVLFITFSSIDGIPFELSWDNDLTANASLSIHVSDPIFEAILWSSVDDESSDPLTGSPQKLTRSGFQVFHIVHAFELTFFGILCHNSIPIACSDSSVLSIQLRC
jgi:hypothetical protein